MARPPRALGRGRSLQRWSQGVGYAIADRVRVSMKQYVMFGQSGLFGDYADIIHALGGVLKKVVVNVPDPARPKRPSFEQRLASYNAAQGGRSGAEAIVQHLEEFEPGPGEAYVIGFRGPHVQPLRDRLVRSFGLRIETLIHPTAVISPTAEIGEGVIVNAGAVISSHVVLGRYLLVNRGASVGHDGWLDEFANIGPGSDRGRARSTRCRYSLRPTRRGPSVLGREPR